MIIDMEFDEVELVDVNLGSNGEVLPEKNNKIALIDADTIIFAACLNAEQPEELLGEEFYTKNEWNDIINNPGYHAHTNTLYHIDIKQAYDVAKGKIKTILDKTGCMNYELHFTSGRKSFRYTQVLDTYKANRLIDNEGSRAPTGLADLKKYFVDNEDTSYSWEEWEADDIVVALKRYFPETYLLVAVDKDVLYSLEGTHFNYYERPGGTNRWGGINKQIDMKFFDVTAIEALKHHYKQCLTGDASDGIEGLHRVGPKTADKLLASATTEEECWEVCVNEYEKRGKTMIDAAQTMRLVSMHQLELNKETNKFEVLLWKPSI